MPRPRCCRRVAGRPACGLFTPAGGACGAREEVVLAVDELEALRLADLEGLYQEQAAGRMKVSRQTFARIVESARKKVAAALVQGKALRIQGGVVEVAAMRKFTCSECKRDWDVPHGTPRPRKCPACGGVNIHRHPADRGGRGRRGGGGRGRCLRGRQAAAELRTADSPED